MNIDFDTSEEVKSIIESWRQRLENRMIAAGVKDYSSSDFGCFTDGAYIAVVANPYIKGRRNIVIVPTEVTFDDLKKDAIAHYLSDDSLMALSTYPEGKMEYTARLPTMLDPVMPDLIVILNKDGSVFKDGKDFQTVKKQYSFVGLEQFLQ